MSERILRALMQLFAVVSNPENSNNKNRKIVELFLFQQLNEDLVNKYLRLYDEFWNKHHRFKKIKDSKKKKTSLSSVKILKICTQINSELKQEQKIIVLLRIFEYINFEKEEFTDLEKEITVTIAETFNISKEEYDKCYKFITSKANNIPADESILIIGSNEFRSHLNKKIIVGEIDAPILVLRIQSVNLYFFRYYGQTDIYLNGQLISKNRSYILNSGSSIRNNKINPVYYSDIQRSFLTQEGHSKIKFNVDGVEFDFSKTSKGLHEFNFSEESGKLIAIMGGSGAGKSTLLNVLNGNYAPSKGTVTINGIDIHREKNKIEGLIGYVSQDDLLIEELTVFENLYYNAKLCFKNKTDQEIKVLVDDLLINLGLDDTRDLKVGNPLDKIISGGQRKRVNIGLELIREPSVLFADEPTSGLSSRDSENIMDLLKELTLKNKLVFVVIHQPSSDIFKMFDQLIILDVGGYPIYYGNPIDSIVYFKKLVNHANANENECSRCGNVNPEQIFNTIESRVIDEYGRITDNRRISPQKWNKHFIQEIQSKHSFEKSNTQNQEIPENNFQIPSRWQQFKIFLKRDLLSKLTNKQYLMINLLETPVLAFILAYFTRYYDADVNNALGYTFMENENIPVYIFISVVVALFIGMTVSAEEIYRDQKIRKRESFLNLSNGTYLLSKILLMFAVSSIQMLLFVLVGNFILQIKDMNLIYWMALFTTACFANMVGLNISSTFNSAVTIYVLIPFLIIPQLLFSGIIVKFDKLNPNTTRQEIVPLIGDVMASRWAFEAISVYQFKHNKYNKEFYQAQKVMSLANYKKNFLIPKLKSKAALVKSKLLTDQQDHQELFDATALLFDELSSEASHNQEFNPKYLSAINKQEIDEQVVQKIQIDLDVLNKFYVKAFNKAASKKDNALAKLYDELGGKEAVTALKSKHHNIALADFVMNKKDLKFIIEHENKLIQKADPIYKDPTGFRAHFYAPTKKVFSRYIDTYWVNLMVIWSMSLLLAITLYFDFFTKLLGLFSKNKF